MYVAYILYRVEVENGELFSKRKVVLEKSGSFCDSNVLLYVGFQWCLQCFGYENVKLQLVQDPECAEGCMLPLASSTATASLLPISNKSLPTLEKLLLCAGVISHVNEELI